MLGRSVGRSVSHVWEYAIKILIHFSSGSIQLLSFKACLKYPLPYPHDMRLCRCGIKLHVADGFAIVLKQDSKLARKVWFQHIGGTMMRYVSILALCATNATGPFPHWTDVMAPSPEMGATEHIMLV